MEDIVYRPGLLEELPTELGGPIPNPFMGSPLFEPPTGSPAICPAPTALLLELEVKCICELIPVL